MHNVVCSCSECQIARASVGPGEAVKGLGDERIGVEAPAPLLPGLGPWTGQLRRVPRPDLAEDRGDVRDLVRLAVGGEHDLLADIERLAGLQLRLADLQDGIAAAMAYQKRLEGELAEIVAELHALRRRQSPSEPPA